ncbi:hypothetical protein Sste5346_006934 [Sporothrix stenoceras]|uniref:DUF6546 domain-containing protein n=1 Tax=Sporothrix stenoceras TaxID=5173 RepID=A0ABR3YY29_9PEZI
MAGISKDGSGKLGRQWVWNRTLTDDIPSLPIVRGLFVTLRFYRVISHKFLASVIVKKLPNLWDIRIEQWTWLDLKGLMACLGQRNWPVWESIRSLSLYHEPNRWRGHRNQQDIHSSEHDSVLDNEFLPRFIKASRSLRELALTGTITAADFFMEAANCPREYSADDHKPPYYFPNLTKLALWEPELGGDGDENSSMTGTILSLAAGVALQMPKLRIMELWNAKKPYIFRYEVTPEQARIIVLAPFRARPEIESEWELASHHHDHLKNKPLVIKYENLDVVGVNELATRGADIFGHLRLADEILDPRSQFQLHCRNISRARFRELNGDNDEAGETDYDDDEADGEGE